MWLRPQLHRLIYLDHQATTPLDGRVLEAMLPYLTTRYGNPASGHRPGWEAAAAVEHARTSVARALGASPEEIVFTSGATESDNLALFGVLEAAGSGKDHVVTVATEHAAVLGPVRRLQERGARVTVLPVDREGSVDPDDIGRALTPRTALLSVMAANNEVGTVHVLDEIGAVAAARDVLFHTDAAQGFGRIPLCVRSAHVDLASLSSHKMYGPKGVGALFVRSGVAPRLVPRAFGGSHEGALRPGTLDVSGIVGFGKAAEIAFAEREVEAARTRSLRDRLLGRLRALAGEVLLNGHPVRRLPNNLHVSFPGVDGESLLLALDDVAASTGSACSSLGGASSHVLEAMGFGPERIRSSVRLGLGRFTTTDDVDSAAASIALAVSRLRGLATGLTGPLILQ